jgi:hypothetical protein
MFMVCLLCQREIMGNKFAHRICLYLVGWTEPAASFGENLLNPAQNAVFLMPAKQHQVRVSHKKQLRPMFSHGIPNARDESRNSKRGDTDLDAVSE